MILFFLKNDIVFPHTVRLLKYFIHFIPAQDNPRSYDQEKKSDKKSENRRIEEDSRAHNKADDSKEEHWG